MPLHQVAFICSGALLLPLAVIQVIMRRQIHEANYGIGSPEISPWDVRFVNGMFGKHGIWNAHRKAYERSALRSSFVVLSAAWLVSVLVAVLAFLVKS
jgi:hypothetical protein